MAAHPRGHRTTATPESNLARMPTGPRLRSRAARLPHPPTPHCGASSGPQEKGAAPAEQPASSSPTHLVIFAKMFRPSFYEREFGHQDLLRPRHHPELRSPRATQTPASDLSRVQQGLTRTLLPTPRARVRGSVPPISAVRAGGVAQGYSTCLACSRPRVPSPAPQ